MIGLAMLVGGVVVLAPLAGDVCRPRAPSADSSESEPADGLQPVMIGHAIPDPRPESAFRKEHEHQGQEADGGPTGQSEPAALDPTYQPPPLPASLPAQPSAMARPAPPLGETYRSTLAVPPPPLLDAHGPPPLAPGWTSRSPQRTQPAMAPVPATYAVRDGDDLTSLAIRFYGHPAGAAAIVAANRDRIADPDILPIGVQLRLPPPWTISAGRTAEESLAIEPGPGIDRSPSAQPAAFAPQPLPAAQPWLDAF